MNLDSLVHRNASPEPWEEGDNIPWHDPDFSRRMLREHLDQTHAAASRPMAVISQQVQWIHEAVLQSRSSAILDLGCGPGFYSQELSKAGHSCTGIDYSPASIAYAMQQASATEQAITYLQADVREAAFPHDQDLVMLIYGELNVFPRTQCQQLLTRMVQSLKPGGQILLEVHRPGVIQAMGEAPPSWYTRETGLWSDAPHLCLQENFWAAEQRAATTRYYILQDKVESYSASYQDYSEEDYHSLLSQAGCQDVKKWPSLTGMPDNQSDLLEVYVARKPG